jgi:DNA-binding MarR family transcriptional regulator
MVDTRSRKTLQRLVRESAWLRLAAHAAREAPVDLTAVQVLAAIALDGAPTFEQTRIRVGISKHHLSRALKSLSAAGLIGEAEGRYFRDRLPEVTPAGLAMLERFVAELDLG